MSSRKFGGRTLARSQALQLLFQAEVLDRAVSEVLHGPYALGQDDPLDEYGESLALGVDSMRDDLDAVISRASTNWTVPRMPAVDRNLLRMALYEILFVDEVATAVSIDEAVELAKAFGTDESSRFVNGLLGRVANEIDRGTDVIAVARGARGAVSVEDEQLRPTDDQDSDASDEHGYELEQDGSEEE